MASPVAFSASDFIATLTLVHDVIGALRNDTNTSTAFSDLMRELYSLERALIQVKRVKASPGQETDLDAIKQAAIQCQATIDRFLDKDKNFRPLPGHVIEKHRWKAGLHRFHWQVSKKHHIDQFRAALAGHSSSINMLLAVFQTQSMNAIRYRVEESAQQISNCLNNTQRTLEIQHNVLHTVSTMIRMISESQLCNDDHLLEITTKLSHAVSQLQQDLPRQVMMQKPVYLEDARGVMAPFNLEFITSKEALVFVLAERFKGSTSAGAQRVEQGLFAISDSATSRDVDLNLDWSRCFRPGQTVKMTMIFHAPMAWPRARCPRCCTTNLGNLTDEVGCAHCGMFYRQLEIEANSSSLYNLNNTKSDTEASGRTASVAVEVAHITSRWSVLDESDDFLKTMPSEQSNDVVEYSRVRLLSRPAPKWNIQRSDSRLHVSSDGLDIVSSLSTETDRPGQYSSIVYSTTLAPTWNKTQSLCYLEVEVLDDGGPRSAVSIGIGEFQNGPHGIKNKDAIAYNKSGRINRNDYTLLGNWGSYTQGSIIGCGLVEIGDYRRTICAFFTRNGRLVGAFNLDPSISTTPLLLASISLSGGSRVRTNFGHAPFEFNTHQNILSHFPIHNAGRYAALDGHPINTLKLKSINGLKPSSSPSRRRLSGVEGIMDFRYGLRSAKRRCGVY